MNQDRIIIRELAKRYTEIAHSESQQLVTENWRKLNSLKPARPTIMIDQIPWHEMNVDDELTCRCKDSFLRNIEYDLRVALYRYKHFKADMVLPKTYNFSKVWYDSGIGVETINQDETGHEGAQSHLYIDQIPDEEALEKLHNHVVTYDEEATLKNKAIIEEVIGDIIPVKPVGTLLWLAIWDRITFWRGAEKSLYSLVDEPEFVHQLMKKLTAIEGDYIDQLEKLGLLYAGPGASCHCMETYTEEPFLEGFDENHIRAKDCWVSGAAQIFSEVSPAMHDEFEIAYMKPLYERFGWVNYGCCEPLHHKIDLIKQIKTVRAISTSPWAQVERSAEAMGKDYLMARKPNPSYVTSGMVYEDAVRKEIRDTLKACERNGTPVMFILKDIMTVNNKPQCLTQWYELVKSEIEHY